MDVETIPYRGRFAPSPSGLLHFGSLVAALGSYLDARSRQGQWLVRVEDLDRLREVPGAADEILRTLDAFGFEWDGPVVYQSRRLDAYHATLDSLLTERRAFGCACTRKEVAEDGRSGPEGPIYPGTCRERPREGRRPRTIRLRTDDIVVSFGDRIQGAFHQALAQEVGDFVIRRADGLFGYQLAVVVDDARQGITQVVRGADLLMSTPRQIHLQRLLGLSTPGYAHLPLVVDTQGRKLSKQARDLPVTREQPLRALLAAYRFLGQRLPPEDLGSVREFWDWSLTHWDLARVPGSIQAPLRARSGSEAE
jgi:glutamyl-Q tRNA(Asp) synthetase